MDTGFIGTSSMKGPHVCPWWLAYTFDNPLRRIFHKPERMLDGIVKPGMTVLDVGCGLGYFSLGMARMVGGSGRVVSVDLQDKMLLAVKRRARRARLLDRIETRQCGPDTLALTHDNNTTFDFALAFWMVHETPDIPALLAEIKDALRPGGRLLIAEPLVHVSAAEFSQTLKAAEAAGFRLESSPSVAFSRAATLLK